MQQVGILSVVNQQGAIAAELTQTLAEQGGYQVIKVATFTPDQPDLAAPVTQLRGAAPDAVFLITSNATQTERARP